jgi:hypothetical protein
MKTLLYILIILILVACNHSTKKNDTDQSKMKENSIDTVLVKFENKIDKLLIDFYAKSYTYCWVTKKDTLDFKIGLTEYVRDSSVQIRFYHVRPILFSSALDKLNECLPQIEQDFNIDRLNSFYFEPPIFYKDMTTELSKSYENQFGDKNISYQKLDEFLMNSWLEEKTNDFLRQLNKSTKRYSIEKFHLLDKDYFDTYIPGVDLNDYPSFSINGMGISVILNDKKIKASA